MTHPPRNIQQHGQNKQDMLNGLQTTMRRYGYAMAEMPIIEDAELFLTKAGDKVAERLFTFERNGNALALRPEFTAAAAHEYVRGEYDRPVRWQFTGPVFEDDTIGNQQAHYERQSAGAELIGVAGAMAEAEVIVMAAQGIMAAGISDWQVVIGHVGLTRHLLSRHALDTRTQRFILSQRAELVKNPAALGRYLPNAEAEQAPNGSMTQADTQALLDILLNTSRASATMGGRTRHDIARRLLKKRQQATQTQQIHAALDFLRDWMNIHAHPDKAMPLVQDFIKDDEDAQNIYAAWMQTLQLLVAGGISPERVIIQPDLARTWDYYTGIVFDIRTKDGQQQLAGGGRYDELTRLIGGEQEIPAVGFAYDVDNLLKLWPQAPDPAQSAFRLAYDEDKAVLGMQWATELRQRGITLTMCAGEARGMDVLTPVEDGLRYGEQTYTMDDVDTLMQALNGQ